MSDLTKDEGYSCEKCGGPVPGYTPTRCCDGRECGCMGKPLSPCWCIPCWREYAEVAQQNAQAMRGFNE